MNTETLNRLRSEKAEADQAEREAIEHARIKEATRVACVKRDAVQQANEMIETASWGYVAELAGLSRRIKTPADYHACRSDLCAAFPDTLIGQDFDATRAFLTRFAEVAAEVAADAEGAA